jgi:hypothetical protein
MQERDRFIQAELKANSMIWYAKSMWQLGLANQIWFDKFCSLGQFSLATQFGNSI